LSNLVVGLLNNDGYMLQIGILMGLGDGIARVYSRPVEAVRTLEVGYVRLSTSGAELGYFEPRQPA
jgi:polynucleotide 5'-kinase involved in rRNA processing